VLDEEWGAGKLGRYRDGSLLRGSGEADEQTKKRGSPHGALLQSFLMRGSRIALRDSVDIIITNLEAGDWGE
jgi:hypothetical protein